MSLLLIIDLNPPMNYFSASDLHNTEKNTINALFGFDRILLCSLNLKSFSLTTSPHGITALLIMKLRNHEG